MRQHMEIQAAISEDPDLPRLPSIWIDSLQTSVPLDDRMNADAAFHGPFLENLKEGMSWYLARRGLRIVNPGGDLRLVGTIEYYEGWKGWGHWGVDVRLQVKLFRGADSVAEGNLRSFLKYSDDEEVEDQEKPKYASRRLNVSFPEILFTRVGMDLSEKLISLMKEQVGTRAAHERSAPGASAQARGRITILADVPNAEVWVDGKLIGTAPLEDLTLPAVPHSIEVRKNGFRTWRREVAILEGVSSRILAELEPEQPEMQ
jgi:hypothetical protein